METECGPPKFVEGPRLRRDATTEIITVGILGAKMGKVVEPFHFRWPAAIS